MGDMYSCVWLCVVVDWVVWVGQHTKHVMCIRHNALLRAYSARHMCVVGDWVGQHAKHAPNVEIMAALPQMERSASL
jgi:hypothetical protein